MTSRADSPTDARDEGLEKMVIASLMASEDASLQWATEYVAYAKNRPHGGDCDKCAPELQAPITCDTCVYENELRKITAALAAWEQHVAETTEAPAG